MFLKIENLHKKYGDKYAVKDFSVHVKEKEFICLLGPSGCGKTTVLRAIGGFLTDLSGRIELDGQDITALPAHLRPVSTVFQSYGLFPHMTVLENVKYGLRFHGLKDKEARIKSREYLELVRLEEHANKRISALSGGQQQRVALARSLVLGPKVLLLDEPLSNLDALLRVQMRDEISRLQKLLGITTIFVTHDQEEAFALADRILLMNNGELVQEGRPEELYENPNSAFSLGFIGESSLLSQNPVTFIRPQRVEIGTSGQAATILQRFFRGDRILYVAEADGQKILVEKLNRPDIRQHEEGENVFLQFDAEALKGH
jgi:iron(III) transport system ATP-binding protein